MNASFDAPHSPFLACALTEFSILKRRYFRLPSVFVTIARLMMSDEEKNLKFRH